MRSRKEHVSQTGGDVKDTGQERKVEEKQIRKNY